MVSSTLTLNIVATSSQVTKGHNHTYLGHNPEFERRDTPNQSEFPFRSTKKKINALTVLMIYERSVICLITYMAEETCKLFSGSNNEF